MPLESGTLIPDLDANNPTGADPKSEGDDHFRLVKRCVQGSFAAFVGTTATPKQVDLTEDQINDAALQSEAATITAPWQIDAEQTHSADITLEHIVTLNGQDSVGGPHELAKVNASNQNVLGNNTLDSRVQGQTLIELRIGSNNSAQVVDRSLGAILVKDINGNDFKAGFRNPRTNGQGGDYTLQQSDEGSIVRKGTGQAMSFTVPSLEAFTVITVINRTSNEITFIEDAAISLRALVGGSQITGGFTLAGFSVVTLWWQGTDICECWGNGIS